MDSPAPASAPWLDNLNESQLTAVTHVTGPMLVVAGAGSGKTRVLTRRIAHLLNATTPGGHPYARPQEILAITFTNKAASEMRERVAELVGERAHGMWVMTFHAACGRLLRSEAEHIGYNSNFTIYDQGDQVRLVKQCIESLELDPKRFTPASVHHQISHAKNTLLTPALYRAQVANFMEETVAQVYELYQRRLVDSNAMDFDDMILHVVHLLENVPEARARWQKRFRYIMVDEYQDTNHAQYRLLKALAAEHHNIVCVGDADQSIYSWRGADIRNITSFEEDFPDAEIVVLDVNYRSTRHILDAANAVVRNNTERIEKELKSVLGDGELVKIVQVEDEHSEARYVAGRIEQAMVDGHSNADIAVFYRTNSQSRVLEDALTRSGRPYQVIGGPKFYERAEVKDAFAYLTVLINPRDGISLQRIVNTPKRGIGATTIAKLQAYADTYGETLWESFRQAQMEGSINAGTLNKLQTFVALIDELAAFANESASIAATIEHLYERSGIVSALIAEDTIESQGRLENLGEFVNVAREYDQNHADPKLPEFLQELSLQAQVDGLTATGGLITLMTMHNAKGLEFPVVFITGMEEGLFPHSRSVNEGNIEEERRLAYVGITRAQRHLTLVHAASRSVFGRRAWNQPSRFLDELPDEHVEREDKGSRSSAASWRGASGGDEGDEFSGGSAIGASGYRQSSGWGSAGAGSGRAAKPKKGTTTGAAANGKSGLLFGSGGAAPSTSAGRMPSGQVPQVVVGDNVRHQKFGDGVVLNVERGELAVIRFADGNERRLMLAYAPLIKL